MARRLNTEAVLAEIFADSESESDFSDPDIPNDEGDDEAQSDSDDHEDPGPEPVQRRGPAYDYAPFENWLLDFNRDGVGPKHLPDEPDEVDIMKLFLTDDILTQFVVETNRYARQYIDSHPNLPTFSRFLKWYDTTLPEMRAFIAILLLTGISKRSSYDLYWSSDPLIDMKGFRDIMSRDRFMNIMSFFHVVNNEDALPRDHPNHDKAFKIRPVIDALVPLWQRYYSLDREIAVDESMIPFKGRTNLMQYMPAKPTKWGLKAWGLADSKTGYMYNWELYLGKDVNNNSNIPMTHRVVSNLCEPLYGLGHIVYMDNFFTSPALFHDLANNQVGACGTLRTVRQGVPNRIKQAKPKSGDAPVTDRDGPLLFIVWFDKRIVSLLSTVHNSKTYRKLVRSKRHPNNVREVDKPVSIQAYTQHMGGIDRADKAMTFYMVLHRCVKWWKKVFFYLMEVCFCNSLIIWRSTSNKRVNAEKFRLNIIHGMLQGYTRQFTANPGRPVHNPPARMIGGEHYIGLSKLKENNTRVRPDCCVCSNREKENGKRRHQTIYTCKKCDKAMCPYPCFERFHTLLNYKIDCSTELHQ